MMFRGICLLTATLVVCTSLGGSSPSEASEPFDELLALLEPEAAHLLLQSRDQANQQLWNSAAQSYSDAAKIDQRVVACAVGDGMAAALSRVHNNGADAMSVGSAWRIRALDELNAVLAQAPDDVQALTERALLFQAVGAYDHAIDDLNRAAEISGDPDVDVLRSRALLVSSKRFQHEFSKLAYAEILPEPLTDEELHLLFVEPLELIKNARTRGAEGIVVEITLALALVNNHLTDDRERDLSEAIAALDRAEALLPETMGGNNVEHKIVASVFFFRWRLRSEPDDGEGAMSDLEKQSERLSAPNTCDAA